MNSLLAKSRHNQKNPANRLLQHMGGSLLAIATLVLVACKPAPAPAPQPAAAASPTPKIAESKPALAPTLAPTPEPAPEALPVPARVEIAAQPLQTIAGRAFDPAPSVRVLSAEGRPVAGVEVTVALDRGTFAATSQTTAVTDANGTALFPVLLIEKAANLHTLSFTAPGLPTAISAQFNIRFAPPRYLAVSTQPAASRVSKPIAGPPAVLVTDSFGNPVPRVPVTVSLAEPSTDALRGTTRITTDESGLAVFDKIQLPRASKKAILLFDAAAAGVPNTPSAPFRVR